MSPQDQGFFDAHMVEALREMGWVVMTDDQGNILRLTPPANEAHMWSITNNVWKDRSGNTLDFHVMRHLKLKYNWKKSST